MVNSGAGRPAGGSDARERVVRAANELFFAQGYAATSSRQVARVAGVSHSLVNYHFGSREGLFAEVMALNLTPSAVVAEAFSAGGRSPLAQAHHIITTALRLWDRPEVHSSIVTVLGEAMREEAVRASVAEFFRDEIYAHIRARVGPREARLRAAGITGVMAGIIFTRYVMRLEPLATLTTDEVVRVYAPSLAVHLR